jgi:cell division protein FtsL
MATRAATVGTGTAIPRRRSGPARPAPRRKQSTEPFAALGRMALRVPDARVLDRLIRGRLWIGLIAGSLVVLVFMQVSLLKLNTGISADVMQSQSLQRDNAELRASVSSLDSGQRIQDIAAARGMVMPDDGQLRFLRAVPPGNGAGAAQAITAPDVQGAQQRAQAMLAQSQQQAANAAAAQQSAMAQQQQAATTGTAGGAVSTTPTATAPPAATPTATTSTGPTQ